MLPVGRTVGLQHHESPLVENKKKSKTAQEQRPSATTERTRFYTARNLMLTSKCVDPLTPLFQIFRSRQVLKDPLRSLHHLSHSNTIKCQTPLQATPPQKLRRNSKQHPDYKDALSNEMDHFWTKLIKKKRKPASCDRGLLLNTNFSLRVTSHHLPRSGGRASCFSTFPSLNTSIHAIPDSHHLATNVSLWIKTGGPTCGFLWFLLWCGS